MVFSSLSFLSLFLPLALGVYFIVPRRAKNGVLFAASLIFYAWGEPVLVGIMIFSSVVDYSHGLLLAHFQKGRRLILISSIVINLSLLAFFKYGGFVTQTLSDLSLPVSVLQLPLPLGISFYTFQTMSYTIDVYRGKCEAQKNFIDFGCYVSMFPQLIAGPIVRYADVAAQLKNRKETIDGFYKGVLRFSKGMAKKVLLANSIGLLWNEVSSLDYSQISSLTALLGILAFAFQIYFDFSGYSDMAIGLGHMFGFTFPENFNLPYISRSITEFWRRWHISLSSWFREYVYIPLGGNRTGTAKNIRNILVVWLLTGLWHGADWNFMLWGLYFGVFLILEKFVYGALLSRLPAAVQWIYSALLVLVGWVLFAVTSLPNIAAYLGALFGSSGLIDAYSLYYLRSYLPLLALCAVFSSALPARMAAALKERSYKIHIILSTGLAMIALLLSLIFIVDSSYNPFLYFRF